jgi:tetratricopeptide (TPR) repeat protein
MQPSPGSVNARLEAAQGFLGLGLPMDAWDELEAIPAAKRGHARVLKVRLEVARALGKWEMVAELARHLATVDAGDVLHLVNLAEAERHLRGPQAALVVLEQATGLHPEFAALHFSLAVELARVGRPVDARQALRAAFELDPQLRAPALDHPELARVIDCEDIG